MDLVGGTNTQQPQQKTLCSPSLESLPLILALVSAARRDLSTSAARDHSLRQLRPHDGWVTQRLLLPERLGQSPRARTSHAASSREGLAQQPTRPSRPRAAARIATRIVVVGGARSAARAARSRAARRLATRRRLAGPRSGRHLPPPGRRHVSSPPPPSTDCPDFCEFALDSCLNTCL